LPPPRKQEGDYYFAKGKKACLLPKKAKRQ